MGMLPVACAPACIQLRRQGWRLNCLHVKASETQACSNFASWNIVERHSTMVPLCFLKMALLMEHGGSSLAAFTPSQL